jgi:hypothetical protein
MEQKVGCSANALCVENTITVCKARYTAQIDLIPVSAA